MTSVNIGTVSRAGPGDPPHAASPARAVLLRSAHGRCSLAGFYLRAGTWAAACEWWPSVGAELVTNDDYDADDNHNHATTDDDECPAVHDRCCPQPGDCPRGAILDGIAHADDHNLGADAAGGVRSAGPLHAIHAAAYLAIADLEDRG